jgi:hypothetical protein
MDYLSYNMKATGSTPPPRTVAIGDTEYTLSAVLKDDFFARTALYALRGNDSAMPRRVILKTNRSAPFFGLPLQWLGMLLTWHELTVTQRLDGLAGIPRLLRRHGATGFIYEYIPGWTLDQEPGIPDRFFDELHDLVARFHRRNVVYVDLNKRGNVIVGDDSRPHIIDFQISLYLPGPLLAPLRGILRRADIYHIYKHKVRLAPGQATQAEIVLGQRRSPSVMLHHILTRPYHVFRKAIFRYLYTRDILHATAGPNLSRENNPARFLR